MLGPFPVGLLISCGLEVNSKTEFHLTRGVNRTGNSAEGRVAGKTQTARIRWLEVVENVRELNRERGPNSFGILEVLGNCRVNIPPVQASYISYAATACVYSQDASAEVSQDRGRVGKDIYLARVVCTHADVDTIDRNSGTDNARMSGMAGGE